MYASFRASMNWLHTWFGLVVGALLLTIFWMGTVSVFDHEIDRWMVPETRAVAAPTVSIDQAFTAARRSFAAEADEISVLLPRDRKPVFGVIYHLRDGTEGYRAINAYTGEPLAEGTSLAGTGFIFPMHYMLHLDWLFLGYWLAGFAGLAMMVLLVSGIAIHRKIIAEFFVFRPAKNVRRSTLDLHNLSGIVGLPFHFLICFSGIVFHAVFYTTLPLQIAGGLGVDVDRAFADRYAYFEREVGAGYRPSLPPSVLVERAEAAWTSRHERPVEADVVTIAGVDRERGYVTVERMYTPQSLPVRGEAITFDAATGAVINDFRATPTRVVQNWLIGFHLVQFDSWVLRWLFFAAGMLGCVMIATGFQFWLQSRTRTAAGSSGTRVVEALATGSITGLIAATGAFFVANRLLAVLPGVPQGDRAAVEIAAFLTVWLATIVDAALRGRTAWRAQCLLIAGLAASAAVLNWVTTGGHPIASIAARDWAVAGMDAMLLLTAVIAMWSAGRQAKPARTAVVAPAAETATSTG